MNATVANLPTGPRGRAIAAALLVLVLMILWTALISPLLGFYGERADELSTQQFKAAHMAVLAEQVPDLKKRAESSGHTGPAPSLVVEGPSDAVAAATLQGKVQSMAAEVGTTLTSVENLPHEAVGTAYHRIGLKISLNASWPVLIALLKAIDQAAPPMLLDDVQIHGSPLPMVNTNRGLEANFTIWALRAGPVGERKP